MSFAREDASHNLCERVMLGVRLLVEWLVPCPLKSMIRLRIRRPASCEPRPSSRPYPYRAGPRQPAGCGLNDVGRGPLAGYFEPAATPASAGQSQLDITREFVM